jgi:hypothetical protein
MLDEKELDDFTNEFLEEEKEELQNQAIPSKEAGEQTPGNKGDEQIVESDGSNVWEGTTETQRNEIKSLQDKLALSQHAASSDRGRNKALHAKALKLEEEIETLKQVKLQAQDPDDTGEYTDKELSDMKEDLPEVSAIVQQETADLKKQLANIESRIGQNNNQPINHEGTVEQLAYEQQQAANLEASLVEKAHPNFKETVNSIDYSTWLSKQPDGVRNMASSPKADNAIIVINMFKDARKPANNDHELDAMVDLPHKGLTKSNLADEDDFDAQFEHFSNQMDK